MNFNVSKTNRYFDIIEFEDMYGECCSIQTSSNAESEAVWVGITKVQPIIMAIDLDLNFGGWVKYPIPENVVINSRMHLNRDQAKEIAKILFDFAETGEIIKTKILDKKE